MSRPRAEAEGPGRQEASEEPRTINERRTNSMLQRNLDQEQHTSQGLSEELSDELTHAAPRVAATRAE
jgi:hypothetical protein